MSKAERVIEITNYICRKRGVEGAVREFIEKIVEENQALSFSFFCFIRKCCHLDLALIGIYKYIVGVFTGIFVCNLNFCIGYSR